MIKTNLRSFLPPVLGYRPGNTSQVAVVSEAPRLGTPGIRSSCSAFPSLHSGCPQFFLQAQTLCSLSSFSLLFFHCLNVCVDKWQLNNNAQTAQPFSGLRTEAGEWLIKLIGHAWMHLILSSNPKLPYPLLTPNK